MAEGLVTLACPTCGGRLKVASDTRSLICEYCGNEHTVHRVDDSVFLGPAVDRLASEMAIKRLQGELANLEATRERRLSELEAKIDFSKFLIL